MTITVAFTLREISLWGGQLFYTVLGLLAGVAISAMAIEIFGFSNDEEAKRTDLFFFNESFDLLVGMALASYASWSRKDTFDHNGILSAMDFKNLATARRFVDFFVATLILICGRGLEVFLAYVLTTTFVSPYSIIVSDILSLFIFFPLVAGVILKHLQFAPLRPNLDPLEDYIFGYIALVLIVTLICVQPNMLDNVMVATLIFGFMMILSAFFPTMLLTGFLITFSHFGFYLVAPQVTVTDAQVLLFVTVTSITTTLVQLLRHAAQYEMSGIVANLNKQARTDALTGLLNRFGLEQEIGTVLQSGNDKTWCVYLIDIDYFKSVNDQFGHPVADEFLKSFANELVKQSHHDDIVCRLGGEEFFVASPWMGELQTKQFAEHLRKSFEKFEFAQQGSRIARTVSIGVRKFTQFSEFSDALKFADFALFEAKQKGRNRVVIADNNFEKSIVSKGAFITEEEILSAIRNNEICYYLQPIYDVRNSSIKGFEALLRWVKPDGSILPAGMFVDPFNRLRLALNYPEEWNHMWKTVTQSLTDCENVYISWNHALEDFANNTVVQLFIDNMVNTIQIQI